MRTHKNKSTTKLVVVDDDANICRLIARIAKPLGASVETIVQMDDSTDMARVWDADLILLDLGMPGLDGIEILRRLAIQNCRARIILISGADSGVLDSASLLGHQLKLKMGPPMTKPFDLEELQGLIQSASRSKLTAGSPGAGDLDAAIEAGEIVPHYQPKVDLETGAMTGVEALARWRSPDFGVIAPDVFIPLAEQAHLMDALTRSIYRTAFKDLTSIMEQHPGLNLSLNLSPSQLTDLRYPDLMHGWATEAGIQPEQVTIEVTESEAMRDPTRYMDILIRFRLKGFHLSVDDFGTGFSSLAHLYQLPFEELKIDKTFVNGLGRRESATVIVKTIVALAHGLGMQVTAEGIEDQQTIDLLLEFGCKQGQGFYYSKALCIEDLLEQFPLAKVIGPSPGPTFPINTSFELEPCKAQSSTKRAS